MMSYGVYSGSFTIIFLVLLVYNPLISMALNNYINMRADKLDLRCLDWFSRMRRARRSHRILDRKEANEFFRDSNHEENIFSLKLIAIALVNIGGSILIFYGLVYLFKVFPFLNFLPYLSDRFY